MDNDVLYWIWLQCCLGADNKKLKSAMDLFSEPKNLYSAGEREIRLAGMFTEREIEKLLQKDMSYAHTAAEKCDKLGYDIICYNTERYPSRLMEIPTPPIVLYTLGRLPDDKEMHIGIVGTRNPDETGKRLSNSFGNDIAAEGGVVVSGGAYGVDIFAHKGAVEAKGKTVCVLWCGINMLNQRTSDFILHSIPERGAVISEYPPDYPARNYTFVARDRIISGMSDSVLVVQAGLGSGALITVKYALQQKRKIYSVPGDMNHPFCSGTNLLLKYGFPAALSSYDVVSGIQGKNGNIHDEMINPDLTRQQLNALMTKPDLMHMRRKPKVLMPPVAVYEMMLEMEIDSDRKQHEQTSFGESLAENQMVQEHTELSESEENTACPDLSDLSDPYRFDPSVFAMDHHSLGGLFEKMTALDQSSILDQLRHPIWKDSQPQQNVEQWAAGNNDEEDFVEYKQNINDNVAGSVNSAKNEMENDLEQLTATARTVYDTISETPVFMDEVVMKSGLNAGEVLSSLTELELYGYIERLPGNRYVRK